MFWTKEKLKTAVNILKRCGSVLEAVDELSIRDGFDVTSDSIRRAFNRHGLMNPSHYLNSDLVPIAQNKIKRSIENKLDNEITFDITFPPGTITGFDVPLSNTKRKWTVNETVNLANDYKCTFNNFINPKPVEKVTKIMIMPDLHAPYHNVSALECFIKACKSVKPDVLVLIGDYLDCLSVSSHAKKATDEKKLKVEIDAGNSILDRLCSLNIPRIIYVFGNHESRVTRFMNEKAPELDGMFLLEEKLKLKERGVEYVPYGDMIRIGKMAFFHDLGRCGAQAARQTLNDLGNNGVFGHSHRAAVVYGGTVDGEVHVCMNVGHMLDINKIDYRNRYTAKREWTTGFGFCYQSEDGTTWANFIPIINGRCIIDGKLVSIN